MNQLASRGQLRMSYVRWALVTVPALVFLGFLSGRASQSGFGNPWFDALVKPAIMPPGWAFGLAWTILYIMFGLALAMVLNARGNRFRWIAVTLFVVAFALNLAWSPLFFAAHKVVAALILIACMFVFAFATTIAFGRVRAAAAWLMVPYLGWLCFAAIAQFSDSPASIPNAETLVPPPAQYPDCDLARAYIASGITRDMQTENKLFDDLTKFINGAAGTIAGMGREAEASAREKAKEWIGGLDFVSRDEFDAVKAMAAAARDEADALKARVAALEAAAKPKPTPKV